MELVKSVPIFKTVQRDSGTRYIARHPVGLGFLWRNRGVTKTRCLVRASTGSASRITFICPVSSFTQC